MSTLNKTAEFLGKVAIVSGSNSGIGKAVALNFARAGAAVTLCGRDVTRLEEARTECVQASGGHDERFLGVSGDVTDSSHRKELVEKTVAKFGRLDILVCNAGGTDPRDGIDKATEESFDFYMNVMVKSIFFLIQESVPHLEKAKGSIVSVSSISAFLPCPPLVLYCTTKAAVDHMTRCLALGLAPKGIRVNTVNPSYVKTGLHRSGTPEENDLTYQLASSTEVKRHLYGNRLVTVEEIAETVAYLASDRASFITGHNLPVDGGRGLLGTTADSPNV